MRALVVLATVCVVSAARTQCPLTWSSAGPQPQLSGTASCSTQWDPDGAGPAPLRLVVGGSGLTAGNESSRSVTTWDGTQWQALAPLNGAVYTLAVWNGNLIAAGAVSGLNHVAQWNGSAWQPLGTGVPTTVRTLTVWNGNLVAAEFTVGSAMTPWIRQWNGTAWSALPAPPSVKVVHEMISYQGLLCVAGEGTGGQGVLERWNGTGWLPSITANGSITSLAVRSLSLTLSTLYVAGWFTSIGGVTASRAASTSGGTAFTFAAIGPALAGPVAELHVRAIAAGTAIVVCLENATNDVVQLIGGAWTTLGTAQLRSLQFFNGFYHGTIPAPADTTCWRYTGSAWVPVDGPGFDGDVRAVARAGDDVVIGGTFASTPAGPASCIARWDGTTFHALGSGMTGTTSPSVDALLTLANGDIVAGGSFTTAGGIAADNIARWNGTTWSPLGTGVNQQVLALCTMPNGDVVAAGKFWWAGGGFCNFIARWDGSAWSPLGDGTNNDVLALAVRSDGRLFASGLFTVAGFVGANRVAQWDGTQWLSLGTGMNGDVLGLAVRPNDDVIAVGAFTFAGTASADRCARWNGSAWSGMGTASINTSPVRAALALPNGDVIVGHGFHTPTPVNDEGLSRWNGSTWSEVGTLRASTSSVSPVVRALCQRTNGELIVGGSFSTAPSIVSFDLVRAASTCMPLVQPYGAGCSSTAGPLVLTAETLPWLGTTFRATTTGIAPGSLCASVIGFTQMSIPLPSLLPQGQPGCTLLAYPDILSLLLPDAAGAAHSAVVLPPSASLLGATFFQQAIPLEFSASFALVAMRGSNGLAVTIGTL